VVVVSGTFSPSGGSIKNPSIGPCDGIVLEIRDIPKAAVEGVKNCSIVSQTEPQTDLMAEKERLMARLDVINALLQQQEAT
jgi:hypothetical protein